MGKRKRTAQRRKNAGNAAVQNDRKFRQTSAAPAAVGQVRDVCPPCTLRVPLHEAEECVKKVKDRDMGYLFENMEKMDIQEERRKTEEARTVGMKNIVLLCRKFGVSKENAVQELMNSYALDHETALEKVSQFWAETPEKE